MHSKNSTMAECFRQISVLLRVATFAVFRYVIVLLPPLQRRFQAKMASVMADTPFTPADFKQSIFR